MTAVQILALVIGVPLAGVVLWWLPVAMIARSAERARACHTPVADTPAPMVYEAAPHTSARPIDDGGPYAELASMLIHAQVEDARARRATAAVELARLGGMERLPYDGEHGLPADVVAPAEQRSTFEDPPKALPRGRDDRGESAWGVVVGVAAILIAWSFLSGHSIKGLIEGGISYGGKALHSVMDGEVPPAPWEGDDDEEERRNGDQKPAAHRPARQGATTGVPLRSALSQVRVVDERQDVPGYTRDAFGTEWTDDTAAPAGGNGCDTRNDVLNRDLTAIRSADGDRCVVAAGKLADPYTGEIIHFDRGDATEVQIDHIYPLSAAWDMGAAEWSATRREVFANDARRNLLAVDGPTNAAKGDSTPAEWLPPNHAYRCTYLRRYLAVADHYDLAVTAADATAVRRQAPHCPTTKGGPR